MRLVEALPTLAPAAWGCWVELTRAFRAGSHAPAWLLEHNDVVVQAARQGDAIAREMLLCLDSMLRALVAAGIAGRITALCLYLLEPKTLQPLHWTKLWSMPSDLLRRAIDLQRDTISYFEPGVAAFESISIAPTAANHNPTIAEAIETVWRKSGDPAGTKGGVGTFQTEVEKEFGSGVARSTLYRYLRKLREQRV